MEFKAIEIHESCAQYLSYADVEKKATGECTKRPVALRCYVLKHKTEFHTDTGTQMGEPGMIAIVCKDHAWPVTMEYFRENYNYSISI